MATSASFPPGPAPFSRTQPPTTGLSSSSSVARVVSPARRWWSGCVGAETGGTGGWAVVVSPPGVRWRRATNGLLLAAACLPDGSHDGGPAGGERSGGGGVKKGRGSFRSSSYPAPPGRVASGINRPLAEILRDLNKRVPPGIVDREDRSIPWYHANRLLNLYAPGWSGEVRDVIFSRDGSVTVVYRVTLQGSDGEAHRESTGTVSSSYGNGVDPMAAAEETAFCRACARFGLGLYLYHDDTNI